MTTAAKIAAALATGETTSVGLTQAALAKASALAHLNAFIALLPETALQAARASDARRLNGQSLGPLDGIPVAVKDNMAVAGVATTDGTLAFAGRFAAIDSSVVARLRQAGAVILGTLNMHEGALGATTDNPFWGRCDNPAAPGYTPGGSSGGSAAAVAAGIVPIALGSDTMGSVRIPAAYCGLWGLKPTRGLVPVTGMSHLSWTLDSIGPVATSADDLLLALRVLAGFDPADPDSQPLSQDWPDDSQLTDFAGLTLGLPDHAALTDCDAEVTSAFGAMVTRAIAAGATICPLTIDNWKPDKLRRAGLLVSEAECGHLIGDILDRQPEGFSDGFRAAINYGRHAGGSRVAAAYRTLALAASGAKRALRGVDAILMPTAPQRPFLHGANVPDNQADFTALANAAGLPAVAFPLPGSGLPISAQLVGPAFSDVRLVAIAAAISGQTP